MTPLKKTLVGQNLGHQSFFKKGVDNEWKINYIRRKKIKKS